MNRELFDNILDKCRGYYSKFSKLNKELREELANARDEAIKDNIATTKELVEIANMLKYQKAATTSQPKQNNVHFAGRRGPMMGNKAEKAKNQKGTIARLFKYFKTIFPVLLSKYVPKHHLAYASHLLEKVLQSRPLVHPEDRNV